MKLVLDTTDTTSLEWGGIIGDMIILIKDHAGGTWELQRQAPDGGWVDISPSPNPFTQSGEWWYRAMAATRYRLSGGQAGAKAWVSNLNAATPETY